MDYRKKNLLLLILLVAPLAFGLAMLVAELILDDTIYHPYQDGVQMHIIWLGLGCIGFFALFYLTLFRRWYPSSLRHLRNHDAIKEESS